jgi:hypothetical protein
MRCPAGQRIATLRSSRDVFGQNFGNAIALFGLIVIRRMRCPAGQRIARLRSSRDVFGQNFGNAIVSAMRYRVASNASYAFNPSIPNVV